MEPHQKSTHHGPTAMQEKSDHSTGYKKGPLEANAYETLQETQPSRVQPGNNRIVCGNTIIAGSTRQKPYYM